MRTASTILALLLCLACRAAEPTREQVAAMLREGDRQRPRLIETAQRRLDNAQDHLRYAKMGKYQRDDLKPGLYFEDDLLADFQSDVERQRAQASAERDIESAKALIARLHDRSIPLIPEIADFLEAGKIGKLTLGGKIRFRHAKDEALVLLTILRTREAAGVISREVLAYVKGADCTDENVVFGRLQLPGVWMVTGTKRMGAADTEEFLVEPVDISQWLKTSAPDSPKSASKWSGPRPLAKALKPVKPASPVKATPVKAAPDPLGFLKP